MTKNRAAVSLGRRGGKVRSERKAISSRANGLKGGAPRRAVIHCPACAKGPAVPLQIERIRQGYYGNCAACGRQLRPIRGGASGAENL